MFGKWVLGLLALAGLPSARGQSSCTPPTTVSIACLFPFNGTGPLGSSATHAKIAWETCAAVHNKAAEPGVYQLNLHMFDSGDTQESTLRTAYSAVNNATVQRDVIGLSGSLNSDLSIVTSYVSNVYTLPIFDIAQTSSIDVDRFPFFLRGKLSVQAQALLWPVILKIMGIRRVSIVADDNVYGDIYAEMALVLTNAGIAVPYSVTVPTGTQPFDLFSRIWTKIRAAETKYVMTFMNEESHVMSFLGAGWVNGALQPSDAPFVLMGFSAAISVLDLVNLKAQDNAARGVPNTTPGLSPAGSIDPDWGLNATIADQLSLSNLLYSLSGSMTLFHTFPTTTLSGIGQEINQTRIQMYGAPFTDRNVELNIVDLCLTATDAIRRMSADRALCVEDSVSTRGRTFLNYLLKTNTPGVAEQLTYSTKSQDLQVPQGVFNLLTSEDDNNVPQYNLQLRLGFPANIDNFSLQFHRLKAPNLVTNVTDAQARKLLESTFVFNYATPGRFGIPNDGLILHPIHSDRTARLIMAIVIPIGVTVALLALALVGYFTLLAPKPLREIKMEELTFEGVSSWLPTYAIAEGVYRGFRVIVQVKVKKARFGRKGKAEGITVLSMESTSYADPAPAKHGQATVRGKATTLPQSPRGGSSGGSGAPTPFTHDSERGPTPTLLEAGPAMASSSYAPSRSQTQTHRMSNTIIRFKSREVKASLYAVEENGARPSHMEQCQSGTNPSSGSDGLSYSMVLRQLRDLVAEKKAREAANPGANGTNSPTPPLPGTTTSNGAALPPSAAPPPPPPPPPRAAFLSDAVPHADEFFDLGTPTCSGMDNSDSGSLTLEQAFGGDLAPGTEARGTLAAAEPVMKMVKPRAHEEIPPSNASTASHPAPPLRPSESTARVSVASGSLGPAESESQGELRRLFRAKGVRHFLLGAQGREDPEQWIRLLGILRSSNIVLALGFCRTNHEVVVLREEMPSGSLSDVLALKAACPLDQEGRFRVVVDIARGLSYLKSLTEAKTRRAKPSKSRLKKAFSSAASWMAGSQGAGAAGNALHSMIHGRCMPSNVFLDKNLNAKLGMDLALPFLPARELLVYSAPEVMRGEAPTAASDVYMLGVLLFEIMSGEPMFQGLADAEVVDGLKAGRLRPQLPPNLPSGIGDIILFCCALEPTHRPNVEDLVYELDRFSFYVELDRHALNAVDIRE